MSRTAYITTPIYYVNDRPHIGHAYTTTLCDVWARAMRLRGREVRFLTGTDEHGVKVEKSAAEKGVSPQQLADENSAEFQRVLKLFDLTNDDFIRTTEPRHERRVQALVKRLLDAGHVYLGEFEGWYDEGQEEYHTETKAKELGYKSPVSGKPLVRAKEHNYYFRLSAFQKPLERFYAEHPGFVQPQARFNEVLGRVRDGLQDVPVTRTNFKWGIPFPGHAEHVIYVWIDALFNYVTALGLGDGATGGSGSGVKGVAGGESGGAADVRHASGAIVGSAAGAGAAGASPICGDSALGDLARFWPADFHVIGKEILWFHAVIWPALLMALEMPVPRCVYAHSFWISNGQKMSKSLGNFIDLPTIEGYFGRYGLDAWRWFMVTRGPLEATDADFRAEAFHETYTADLVNTVGNCASRVTAMMEKYFDGVVPEDPERGGEWPARVRETVAAWEKAIDDFALADAASAAIGLLRQVDGFINATEPFKLAKDPAQKPRLASILAQCAECVRVSGVLLAPLLPGKMNELAAALGQPAPNTQSRGGGTIGAAHAGSAPLSAGAGTGIERLTAWGGLAPGTKLTKCALFPRVDAPKPA
ncbi:MAG: class I tRNA ligase family protein [Phycisphaeraceae bacterium]|nr:class I tRNA ligase family protein [Phycisphaeraceae bacterium]